MALGRYSQRRQFSQFNPLSFEELSAIPMYKTQQAMKVYEGASVIGDIKIDDGLSEYDKQSANKIRSEIDSSVSTIQQGIMAGELDPIQGANAIFDLKNKIKGFSPEIDRLNSLKPAYSAFNEEGRKGVMAGHITSDDFKIGMDMALKNYNSKEGSSFSPGPFTPSFESNELRDDIMKMRPIRMKELGYRMNPDGEYVNATGEIVTLGYRELLPQAQRMVANDPKFKAMVNRDIEYYMLNNQNEDGSISLDVMDENGNEVTKNFTDPKEFRQAYYTQELNRYAVEVASLAITNEGTASVNLNGLSGNGGKTTSLVNMTDEKTQEAWGEMAKEKNVQGYSLSYNGQPVDKETAAEIYVQSAKDKMTGAEGSYSPAWKHFFEVERKENGEPIYKNGRYIYTGEFKVDPSGERDYEGEFLNYVNRMINRSTSMEGGPLEEFTNIGFEFNELKPGDVGYQAGGNEATNTWTNHINETQAEIQVRTGKDVGDVVTNKTVAEIALKASEQEEDNEVTIIKNYPPYQQAHGDLITSLVNQKNMATLLGKSFSYQKDGEEHTTIVDDKRNVATIFGNVEKVTYEGGIRDGAHQGDAVFSITNDINEVFRLIVDPERPDLQATEAPYANATTRYYNNSPSAVNAELKESYTSDEMKEILDNENVPGLQESSFVVPGNKKDEEYHFQVLWQKRPYTIDEETGEMQVGWNRVGKFYIEQFDPATGEPVWIPYEDMTVYEPDQIYTTMDSLRLEMKKSEDEIEDGYIIPGVPNI